LNRVRTLPVAEILPGHEYRFTDVAGRVAELLERYATRRMEIVDALDRSDCETAWSLMARLHWARPVEQLTLEMLYIAVGETYAHLVRAEADGLVIREMSDGKEPSITWRSAGKGVR
jgi:hypothetical protein